MPSEIHALLLATCLAGERASQNRRRHLPATGLLRRPRHPSAREHPAILAGAGVVVLPRVGQAVRGAAGGRMDGWASRPAQLLTLAIVGTAVALVPVVRRYSEGVALGHIGLRTLEAAIREPTSHGS